MKAYLVSTLLLAACGGGSGGGLDTGPLTADEAEPLCRQGCEHDVTCGTETDLEMCVTDCIGEIAGWARGDAFQDVAECNAALACGANDDQCIADVQPLAIHEEWEQRCRTDLAACIDPAELDQACEVSPDPSNDDIGFFRFIAPEIMEEIIACVDMTGCDAQLMCIEGVLDAHGINF